MSTYPAYRPRGGINRLFGFADDFMNWFLFGHETWLVALLKGVPLFLFVYFVIFYIPNYIYYLITVELPFLRFSDDVGFLVANGIGMGNLALIVVAALLVQAARQYANALWVAESDPNQAWLHLVSAVEVLSSDVKLGKPVWQRLETSWPDLWTALEDVELAQRTPPHDQQRPRDEGHREQEQPVVLAQADRDEVRRQVRARAHDRHRRDHRDGHQPLGTTRRSRRATSDHALQHRHVRMPRRLAIQ